MTKWTESKLRQSNVRKYRRMESAEFWMIRGNDSFDQEKFEESLVAYNLALKIDPRNKSAMVGRGASLGALGKHEEALKVFEKTLKFDPTYDVALRNKGLSLIQLERYREAIGFFNRALRLNPKDHSARYYKGVAYAKMGNNHKAVYLLTDHLR